MAHNKIKNNGYALVLAIVVMGITTLVAVALAGIVLSGFRQSRDIDSAMIAFYAAESGIEENLYRLSQGELCSTSAPIPSFISQANFVRACASEIVDSVTYNLIRSTGYFGESRMALQVRVPSPPSP